MTEQTTTRIEFTTVPITGLIGCCVPVIPGTTEADASLEDRTELCAIDANWLVGMVPTCDIHARFVCEKLDIDWPELVAEAGRDLDNVNRPVTERTRHSQEDVRRALHRWLGGPLG